MNIWHEGCCAAIIASFSSDKDCKNFVLVLLFIFYFSQETLFFLCCQIKHVYKRLIIISFVKHKKQKMKISCNKKRVLLALEIEKADAIRLRCV